MDAFFHGFGFAGRGFGQGDAELTEQGIRIRLPLSMPWAFLKGALTAILTLGMRMKAGKGRKFEIPYSNIVSVGINSFGRAKVKCIDLTFLDETGEERRLVFAPYTGGFIHKYHSEEWAEIIKQRVALFKH